MKSIKFFIFILMTLGVLSCRPVTDEPVPFSKTYFDTPFPKKSTKDLSWILGEKLMLKTSTGDTIVLKLSFNEQDKTNTIYNETHGYELFNGTVCKYKGNYILSEQVEDSLYRIYVFKVHKNLIYGLTDFYNQGQANDESVENGLFDKMVLHKDSSTYLLHPDKKILGKYYKMLFDSASFEADTIISKINLKAAEQIDKEDIESKEIEIAPVKATFSYNAYPNPVKDVLHVKISGGNKINYKLLDLKGQVLLKGVLVEGATQINVGSLPLGVYILSFINPETKKPEQLKIIKK